MTAVAACGAESAKSTDSDPVAPTGAPLAPVISSVTPDCGSLTVNWGTVSGDTGGYNIYRKLSGGSYGAAIANVASGTATYADSGAVDSTKTYVYAVTAVGPCESAKSTDSTGASPTNPGITVSPANYTAYEGFPGTFSVTAINTTSYQWEVNKGSGWNNAVEGADGTGSQTTTFTTVAATTAMNGYQYRCVATGSCLPATSASATLSLGTQFRSLATGGWATNTSWQVSADGSTWFNAPTGVYPGATAGHTDAVQVRATHTITIASSTTNSAGSVTIDPSGILSLGTQSSATDANVSLQIAGNLANSGTITAGQGNGNLIVFTGTTTWSGSGDLTGAGVGKMGFTVNAGATLTLSCNVTLRNSTSNARVTINGTLLAGAHTIIQSGTSATSYSTFTVGPGATVETANASGLGGTNLTSTSAAFGTFQSTRGVMALDPRANYIFDGTGAQSAYYSSVTAPVFFTAANNVTINNTGGTVTLPATAISGQLYLQSGLVSFGSTTTSTAGALSFDGSTYQATGTWGNTGSLAANQDPARFADTGYVTVVGPFAIGSSTQFRSRTSGDWNVAGSWEASPDNGTTWGSIFTGFTPGSTPGSTHTVYVRSPHTVTLTEAEACGPLTVNSGGTLSVSTQALTLAAAPSLSGALRMTVNKTGPNTFTGASVVQSSGTLTNGGTLNVATTGSALASGDTLVLLTAPAYAGGFTTVTGPTVPAGLARDLSQLTNGTGGSLSIICDGTLTVTTAATNNVTCHGGNNGSITANTATGGSGSGYAYSVDGSNYQAGITFSNLTAGSYTLTVKDTNGCVASVQVPVSQPAALVVSAGSAKSICAGSSVAIGGSPTASGGTSLYTYQWSPATGLDSTNLANPTAAPASTTTYTVMVTDTNGCMDSSQVTVTVNPLPTTSAITGASSVNAYETGVHYSVTLTSGSTYTWSVPESASITSGATGPDNHEIVVTFGSASGSVNVVETTAVGCTGSLVVLPVNVQNALPVTITSISDTVLAYSGGAGAKFVLLSSPSLEVPSSAWTREQTNSVTPGTFTIPAVGSSTQLFYLIQSE